MNCGGTRNAIKTASRDKTTGEISHFPIDAFNLRHSPTIVSDEAFGSGVRKGTLQMAGMPAFDELSAGDVEAIRQYLRRRAHELVELRGH